MLISERCNKKAQAWSFDVVMATVLFMSTVILLFIFSINYLSRSDENLETLFYEGNLAAELILSEENFGIMSGSTIDQDKLDNFSANYSLKKLEIGVVNEFYFTFDDMNVAGSPVSYVGNKTLNPDNEIQITRVTIYNKKPVKFQLRVWQ